MFDCCKSDGSCIYIQNSNKEQPFKNNATHVEYVTNVNENLEEKECGEIEQVKNFDDLMTLLGVGRWSFVIVSCYACWALLLPFFSLGGAFLNAQTPHWCAAPTSNTSNPEFRLWNASTVWNDVGGRLVRSSCEQYDLKRWVVSLNSSQLGSLLQHGRTQRPTDHEGLASEESLLLSVLEGEALLGSDRTWVMSHINISDVPRKQCDSWEYDRRTFQTTVTSDWDLVCDSSAFSPFFQSFYFFGATVGEPLLGYLSDRLGRRWVLRRVYFVFLFGSVTSVFTTSYSVLLAMRFLLGIVHACCSVAYVLVLETCAPRFRSTIGQIVTSIFAVTGILFGAIAYFIRDWRTLQAVCILPALLHLFYLPFLSESPRWQLQQGAVLEAGETLVRAAKMHGTQMPSNLHHLLHQLHQKTVKVVDHCPASLVTDSSYRSLLETFKLKLHEMLLLVQTPVLRSISLTMFGCWFCAGLAYWGMSLAGGTFSSDPFLYMSLSSLMEIFGYIWTVPLLRCFGRRTVLAGNFFGCAIALFSILFVPQESYSVVFILAIFGKLLITAAYNMLYLYAVELFPTCVRNRGLNLSSMMARVASIASPFVVTVMAHTYSWAPSAVFGGAAAFASLLSLLLPESRGKPLLNSVGQVESVYGKVRKATIEEAQEAAVEMT